MNEAVARAWPGALGAHLSRGLATRLPVPESEGRAEEDDQRLGFARLLLRPKPLYLIADPVENAGPDAPQQVKDVLAQAQAFVQAMRGRATIVIATQNPALIALADKALVLDKGQGVHFGPLEKPDPAADNEPTGSPS
jgi:ABC-type multidrug transport system fused ATPase/permease subunit